jgi:hypothetical protein
MAKEKIRFAPVKLRGSASIQKKRVRQANGKMRSLYSLDSESPTFARDLGAVFAKNVMAARRENSGLPVKSWAFINEKPEKSPLFAFLVPDTPPKKKSRKKSKVRPSKKQH